MKRAAGVAAGAFDCGCADVLFLGRERPAAEHKAFPFGEGGRAQRGRMRSFSHPPAWPGGSGHCDAAARICRFQRGRPAAEHEAFPFGEGGRAQRGRMRSFSRRPAWPGGSGRCDAAVRPCRFQRGRTSSPARQLSFSFHVLKDCCVAPGLPPGPAQGLTPPLHPRKGHRPLTLSTLARSRGGWSVMRPPGCSGPPIPSPAAPPAARRWWAPHP